MHNNNNNVNTNMNIDINITILTYQNSHINVNIDNYMNNYLITIYNQIEAYIRWPYKYITAWKDGMEMEG